MTAHTLRHPPLCRLGQFDCGGDHNHCDVESLNAAGWRKNMKRRIQLAGRRF